jgi:dephospho-CoA kinase
MRRPLRIGLTGGIGSGKTTVAAMLVRVGATLIDTDAIAHALTASGGAAMPALRAAFGNDVADAQGALDRVRMRSLVFTDPAAKARLEAILHPAIAQEAERQASQAGGPAVVFDVPLLVESGLWRARVDRVLVIDCSEATQIERTLLRPGWTREMIERVIAQQASRQARREAADAVVYNDGITEAALLAQVHTLWSVWLSPHPTP